MPKRISREEEERLYKLFASAPKTMGRKALAKRYAELYPGDTPLHNSTVENYRIRWRQLPQEEQVGYAPVYWPESFEGPHADLPWESAPVIFELLRKARSEPWMRPTVRFARYFWRVTEVAPERCFDCRWRTAEDLDKAATAGAREAAEFRLAARERLLSGRECTPSNCPGLVLAPPPTSWSPSAAFPAPSPAGTVPNAWWDREWA